MSETKMTLLFGTSNTTHSDVWRIQSLHQKQSAPLKKNINCTNNTRETNKRRHIGLSLLIAVATLIGIVGCPSPPNNVEYAAGNIEVWKRVARSAGWSGRDGHTTVVFNDKIWVLGGGNGQDDSKKNDVWSSKDGKTWNQETEKAKWSGRWGHTTVVFNGKIWILGGHDDSFGNRKNDVWTYGLP